MKKLYLVTGALGHLGNTMIKKLIEQGEAVRGLALPNDRIDAGITCEIVRGNILDTRSLEPLFQNTEGRELTVIHTAGIVSIASKFQRAVYDVNVTGTKNIIAMCQKYGAKKLVYTSSVHAIPEQPRGKVITEPVRFDPNKVQGLYAKTKAEAAQLVLDAASGSLQTVVVNPSGIIGPQDYGHGHLTQLIMDYLDGRLTACVKGGYDFVDVRDVADGILAAAQQGTSGECYILSGHFAAIPDLLEMLHEISGRRKIKTVLPLWFAKGTAPLAEFYYKLKKQPPLYTSYSLFTLQSNAVFSCKKAEQALGYSPRPLQDTLKDTVLWLQKNMRVKIKPIRKGNQI